MNNKVPFVNYPLQYQNLKNEMDRAMQNVLSRGDLILRQDVEKFEKRMAHFAGVKFAVGVNSCTDALHLSLRAAGISQNDEIITVAHTPFPTIEAIVQCGAKPILVDVGEDFTMDITELEKAITPQTKGIMPVHLNGRICNMEEIIQIAEASKILVIEDAAQALGAEFDGKKAGSFGLTGCFSFYPAKILGGYGDGGLVVTNDEDVAGKIKIFRDHGQKTRTEIIYYGFNSRLDNIQAAVLNIKLKYVPNWIQRRREIANLYDQGLSDIPEVKLPPKSDERFQDVYQNYVLRVLKRDELATFLKRKGIETLIKDPIPLHHHKALNLSHFHLPYTEQLAKEIISIPMYPELTPEQIEYTIRCIKDFYAAK